MKKVVIVFLSFILIVPASGQVVYLKQVPAWDIGGTAADFPTFYDVMDYSGAGGGLSIIPIEPHVNSSWGTWWVGAVDTGDVAVAVKNFIYGDPPGTQNVKVADLYVGAEQFDVIVDYGYWTLNSPTVGGYVTGGEMSSNMWKFDNQVPYNPDGTPVYIEVGGGSPAAADPGYEFVGWSGKAVDLGFTIPITHIHPTDPYYNKYSLGLDMDGYFDAVPEQCYIKTLYGIPTGPGLDVSVLFPGEGVSLVFDEITSSGHAILDKYYENSAFDYYYYKSYQELPDGFQLGESGAFYDISTTAGFSGMIEVAIDYSDMSLTVPEDMLQLLHYYDGAWYDCTTSIDTLNDIIYGSVNSLSPFAVATIPDPGSALLVTIGLGFIGGGLRKRRTL